MEAKLNNIVFINWGNSFFQKSCWSKCAIYN